jgi:lipopolysaccharide transport protein LptA
VAWQPAEKLRVKGDQIDIFFHDDNRVKKMTAYGRPSRVRKLFLIDDQEEFRSKSLRTDYYPGELFVLTKNAVVWKDDGTYVGEKIEYDLETKIARAVSEPKSKKRVRVILQPSK